MGLEIRCTLVTRSGALRLLGPPSAICQPRCSRLRRARVGAPSEYSGAPEAQPAPLVSAVPHTVRTTSGPLPESTTSCAAQAVSSRLYQPTPAAPAGTAVLRKRFSKVVTFDTSHPEMSPPKAESRKAPDRSVTDPVSHADRSWLKAVAPAKMSPMSSTWLVSQVLSGWLKVVAPAKVACMSRTAPTCQSEISVVSPESWNVPYMSATFVTYQVSSPEPVNDVAPLKVLVRSVTSSVAHPLTVPLKELASRNALDRSWVPVRSRASVALPVRFSAP